MAKNQFYEFFAGVGLARVGLSPEWEPLWANDFSPKKAETYIANFGSEHFHLGDIAGVQPDDLPGWAHMAWASFPCQDLSLAGWRRGMNGHRSGVYWAFWQLMRDLGDRKPPVIVLENVVGLLHSRDFKVLVESLVSLDMRVGALVIDAVRFVPQSRPRVFIIAVDKAFDTAQLEDSFPDRGRWFPKSVWDAHSTLSDELRKSWIWWNLPMPSVDSIPPISDVVENDPIGIDWHTPEETERLLSLMAPLHRERVENAQRSGERQIGFIYKRTRNGHQQAEVRFDGVAGCLRTPTGGSSRQTIMIVDGVSIRSRLISPREMSRLMGAPDWFQLPSRYNQAYYAMGDAVVVPVVNWLSLHLLSPLVEQYDATVGHYGWSLQRAGG